MSLLSSVRIFKCLMCICMLYVAANSMVLNVNTSNFQSAIKAKKCMFLYITEEGCEHCKLLYFKYLIAVQTFQDNHDVSFGRVSDKTLHEAFEVDTFPGIVFYEYGSATPKHYKGDLTPGAIEKVISEAVRMNFKKLDRHHTLELTWEMYPEVMKFDTQYRLVMLHEDDDEDEIESFDEVAETFENEEGIVIARINVNKQKKLRQYFKSIDFPCFYWYPKGGAKKKRYGGLMNVQQMVNFINKEAGLFRTKGGRLNPYAGLITQIDEVINMYGKELYEIRKIHHIKTDVKRAIAKHRGDIDDDLSDFYLHLLDELEEDRTIETLDESRTRIFRDMDGASPLQFDQLVRKRNIVQKYIDVIGNHLLHDLTAGDFGTIIDQNADSLGKDGTTHAIEFHDEF